MDQSEEFTPKKQFPLRLVMGIGCGLLGLNLLFTTINWVTVNNVSGRQQIASESTVEATENIRMVSTKLANLAQETQALTNAQKKQVDQLNARVDRLNEVAIGARAAAYEAASITADNHDATNRQLAKILASIPKTRVGAGSNTFDDLIISRIANQWKYPEGASSGKRAELIIHMMPDGTISAASISTSSGDIEFDKALVEAVRNVGRIPELANLDAETFARLYAERKLIYIGDAKAL